MLGSRLVLNNVLRNLRFINYCLFSIESKLFVPTKHYSTASKPIQNYLMKDQNYKTGKKSAVRTLEKLFYIKKLHALAIVSKHKQLKKAPSNVIMSNYQVCKENGINEETLLENPEILGTDHLAFKIQELKGAGLNLDETAPLLKLTTHQLKYFIENTENETCFDKLQMLSSLLKQPIRTICNILSEKCFLLNMGSDKMKARMSALEEFGIEREEIINDLWVLRYSDVIIRKRLIEAKQNNIDVIKTWMVRAPDIILNRYITRRSDTKSILGNQSIAEFLSAKLDCSVETAKYIMSKHPALETKSLKKVKEIIDFLYTYGFKPGHICRVPKILLHSVETTRKRLKELTDQGMELESLHILTKSQKQYMQYYEGLKTGRQKGQK